MAAMLLTVAACGQSSSDSAVEDAPLGKPTVTATASVGKGPLLDVTVDPSTGTAYVTSSGDDLLSLIDADGGISAIEAGRAPSGVAVVPSTHTAYVTSLAEGRCRWSTSHPGRHGHHPRRCPTPGHRGGSVDPHPLRRQRRRRFGVRNRPETRTVSATVEVGDRPGGMGVDPSTHALYVATTGPGGVVSVIDAETLTVTDTIAAGRSPHDVAVDPSTRTAFVPNADDGTVSVLDLETLTVTDTLRVGKQPYGATVDPSADTAYVTNMDDGSVSVIDTETRTVTDTVPVGSGPQGVAVDPTSHTAYVVNVADDTVSVIER